VGNRVDDVFRHLGLAIAALHVAYQGMGTPWLRSRNNVGTSSPADAPAADSGRRKMA
jgi:hypothetical protein